MHSKKVDTAIIITVTFAELVGMESHELAIYATPDVRGRAVEAYLATTPKFSEDFLLARVEDFDAEEGYRITGGWEEMDQADMDAQAADEYTIIVPRTRQAREA